MKTVTKTSKLLSVVESNPGLTSTQLAKLIPESYNPTSGRLYSLLKQSKVYKQGTRWYAHALPENGKKFTVKSLIGALAKFPPDTEIVLTITDDGVRAYELQYISDGWLPSGVISLESSKCIMS